jgi:hypothetical protein
MLVAVVVEKELRQRVLALVELVAVVMVVNQMQMALQELLIQVAVAVAVETILTKL